MVQPDTLRMLTVAVPFWTPNEKSADFSVMYDEHWVECLFHGFRQNLSKPFRFLVFTDRVRDYSTPLIEQRLLTSLPPITYRACLEPFALDTPTLLVGLDTIVTGNCDALADYCLTTDKLAVPRDPIFPDKVCNGVNLIPAGMAYIWDNAPAHLTDMEWIREQDVAVIDDLFPSQCVSYRCEVKERGLRDARLVYFHGSEKPHELAHIPWVREHWAWR